MVDTSASKSQHGLSDEQLQAAFRAALSLPRQNKAVADWLFGDHAHSFSPQFGVIPPDAFKNAWALYAETTPSSDHLGPFPAKRSLTENGAKSFVVFIPVEEKDGLSFGYTYSIGIPLKQRILPIRDLPRAMFGLIGRFVYQKAQDQALICLRNFTTRSMLLTQIEDMEHVRVSSMFSIPDEDYDYYRMPSRCNGMTHLYHRRYCPVRPTDTGKESSPTKNSSERVAQHPSEIYSSLSPQNLYSAVSSSRVWDHSEVGHEDTYLLDKIEYASERSRCNDSFDCEACVGTIDPLDVQIEKICMSGSNSGDSLRSEVYSKGRLIAQCSGKPPDFIVKSTRDLGRMLLGKYRSSVNRFMSNCTPDQKGVSVHVKMDTDVKEVDAKDREMLQMFAARAYYADSLSVCTDLQLHAMENQEDAEDGSAPK